jgi:hypothetical protein
MRKLLLWGGTITLVLATLCLSYFGVSAVIGLDLAMAIKASIGVSVITLITVGIVLFTPGPTRRPDLWATACLVLGLMLVSGSAFAQMAVPTASTIDLSTVVNQLIGTVVLCVGAVASYLLKRGVLALEGLHLLQTNSVHSAQIDSAVADAVSFAQAKLQALADPHLQMSMTNTVLAEAASLVATSAPMALSALGLTPAAIVAKIQLALGDPLAAADTPAAPAAAPAIVAQQAA